MASTMAAVINACDLQRNGLQTSQEAQAGVLVPPDGVPSSSALSVQDAQLSTGQQERCRRQETSERSPRPPSPPSTTSAPTDATAKITMCEICHRERALYRCPRCLVRTCSLACCNEHKRRPPGTEPAEGGEGKILCNGKRDRTAFLHLKDFTDSTMRSDYHFLEDCLNASTSARQTAKAMGCAGGGKGMGSKSRNRRGGLNEGRGEGGGKKEQFSPQPPPQPLLRLHQLRTVSGSDGAAAAMENGKDGISSGDGVSHKGGDPKRRRLDIVGGNSDDHVNGTSSMDGGDQWLANFATSLKRLVGQARERGCNLLLMPNGMSRRRGNTTTYNRKKDLITWKVDWVFHRHRTESEDGESATSGGTPGVSTASTAAATTVVSDRFVETSLLSDELGKHLEVGSGRNGCVVSNRSTRSLLKEFCSPRSALAASVEGRPRHHLFMKRLPCPSSNPLYVELDLSLSLREALKGSTVVEYPQIEVVLPSDAGRFKRLVMEEESDMVEEIERGEAMEQEVCMLEEGPEGTTKKTATDIDS